MKKKNTRKLFSIKRKLKKKVQKFRKSLKMRKASKKRRKMKSVGEMKNNDSYRNTFYGSMGYKFICQGDIE